MFTFTSTILFTFSGLSTWGRRVGRKFDQIKHAGAGSESSNEKLQYVVNPVLSHAHPPPTPPSHSSRRRAPPPSEAETEISSASAATWSHMATPTSTDNCLWDSPSKKMEIHAKSPPPQGEKREVHVKRRVSRVESLRNLFFNKGGGGRGEEARRLLLKKRARSAEKEKVST